MGSQLLPAPIRKGKIIIDFQGKHRFLQALKRSIEGSGKDRKGRRAKASNYLSQSTCLEERRNKTALNQNTGRSNGP